MRVTNHKLRGLDGKLVPFVRSPNTSGPSTGGEPRFLVIHYTAGNSAAGTVNYFRKPSSKVSAHLVIGQDGDITQMLKFDQVGWHAGKSRWKNVNGVNSHSVGIELSNWGKLQKSANGPWRSWTGAPVPSERVVLAEHKNSPGATYGWEVFDSPQIEACLEASRAIVEAYGMDPWDVVGHDDISPIRKIDPGPAFEMDRFKARLFGRSEDSWNDVRFRVNSLNGLNLRSSSSVEGRLIKNLANGTEVNVIENLGNWWLVAEVVENNDDTTGYAHSHWLQPS